MSTTMRSSALQAPPRHEVIRVPDIGEPGRDELRQQCFDLRIAVFIHEQGIPPEIEFDQADETATHFLLRLVPSSEPVGTIRGIRMGDSYKLSRLAVLKEYRKYGLGRSLLLALHEWVVEDARRRGAAPGSLVKNISHAHVAAKPFYVKNGYEPEGDEFDEDGARRQKMVVLLRISSESDSHKQINEGV